MTTVAAFILVLTTWAPGGPRFVMQEFNSQAACEAEQAKINSVLSRYEDRTTTVRCTPKG